MVAPEKRSIELVEFLGGRVDRGVPVEGGAVKLPVALVPPLGNRTNPPGGYNWPASRDYQERSPMIFEDLQKTGKN